MWDANKLEWLRLSKESIGLERVFDSGAFKSAVKDLIDGAPPPNHPKERFFHPSSACVLEEFSVTSSRWTKIERLQSFGFGIRDLHEQLLGPASDFLGEDAVLLKDKVNINCHGLTGFPVHQDFESYRFFPPRKHVTAMIPFERLDSTNGCMYFANNYKVEIQENDVMSVSNGEPLLKTTSAGPMRGNLSFEIAGKLTYFDAILSNNEILLFNSFIPHGSHNNTHAHDRIALFLTFCPAACGFGYDDYYRQRYS